MLESLDERIAPAVYTPADTSDASSAGQVIQQAESDGNAVDTISLDVGTSSFNLSDNAAGPLLLKNASTLPHKTLNIVGNLAGHGTIITGNNTTWENRFFNIVGSDLTVNISNLTIQGGYTNDSGPVGGPNGARRRDDHHECASQPHECDDHPDSGVCIRRTSWTDGVNPGDPGGNGSPGNRRSAARSISRAVV